MSQKKILQPTTEKLWSKILVNICKKLLCFFLFKTKNMLAAKGRKFFVSYNNKKEIRWHLNQYVRSSLYHHFSDSTIWLPHKNFKFIVLLCYCNLLCYTTLQLYYYFFRCFELRNMWIISILMRFCCFFLWNFFQLGFSYEIFQMSISRKLNIFGNISRDFGIF